MWCAISGHIAEHLACSRQLWESNATATACNPAPLLSLLHQKQFQAAQEKYIMKDGECGLACLYSGVLKMGSPNRKPKHQRATGRSNKWRPEPLGRQGPSGSDSAFAHDSSSHFTPQEQQVMDRKGSKRQVAIRITVQSWSIQARWQAVGELER